MLKNTFKKLLAFCIVAIMIIIIDKTYSFFFDSTTSSKIVFQTSEWSLPVSTIKIIKDSQEYSVEEKISNAESTRSNLTINSNDPFYLSFQYKVISNETAFGFDDPNIVIKINNQLAFDDYADNSEWKNTFINLNNFTNPQNLYEVSIEAINTFDDEYAPNIEIKNISTEKFLAKKFDLIKFYVSKENSKVKLKYFIEVDNEVIQKDVELVHPFEFQITENFYDDKIEYYSIDSYANKESIKTVNIYTDFEPPQKISDLECYDELDDEININFTLPIDNFLGKPTAYDFRVSETEINQNSDWSTFQEIYPVSFRNLSYQIFASKIGDMENLLFTNLENEKKYLAIKSKDQAGNLSEISSCVKK